MLENRPHHLYYGRCYYLLSIVRQNNRLHKNNYNNTLILSINMIDYTFTW